ncbi:hypothetical protein [Streptomyces sp. HGB0020]|uniref:hypothetical protein n=1 Tax=Streptomyces sp. HGB0020 TaxID=1078086 RepID=UPI00034E8B68|nr:hypothetical protein [Streptomyces sp. HGB0020]EPD63160.1 hypothetical protein HMPREF1211_03501 [Streptomyces sp. HGB0020]
MSTAHIRSTVDPATGKAACLLRWGTVEALLQPDVVLNTARDLMAAAAGAKTGKPWVHIARGSMKGELDPDQARQMAAPWTEAAIAAQIDVRLRYALGELDQLTPDDIDAVFGRLQSLQR